MSWEPAWVNWKPTKPRGPGGTVTVSLTITRSGIVKAATKGAVIAVPVSALSLAADGTSRVQVERGGNLEYVTVQPGLSVGGYVEVTADDGRLTPGQLVVVGYKMVEPGS